MSHTTGSPLRSRGLSRRTGAGSGCRSALLCTESAAPFPSPPRTHETAQNYSTATRLYHCNPLRTTWWNDSVLAYYVKQLQEPNLLWTLRIRLASFELRNGTPCPVGIPGHDGRRGIAKWVLPDSRALESAHCWLSLDSSTIRTDQPADPAFELLRTACCGVRVRCRSGAVFLAFPNTHMLRPRLSASQHVFRLLSCLPVASSSSQVCSPASPGLKCNECPKQAYDMNCLRDQELFIYHRVMILPSRTI